MNSQQRSDYHRNMNLMYRSALQHIDSITPSLITDFGPMPLNFAFDGKETWTCSRELPEPINFALPNISEQPIDDACIIFEVVGTISETLPVGRGRRAGARTRSFWVESRPDRASRALWNRIPEAFEAIAARAGRVVNTSDLYKVDYETGVVSLHIKWASSEPSIFSVSCSNILTFFYH